MQIENQKGIELQNLRPKKLGNGSQYIPEEFRKVASDMESQFTQFMLNEMNKTVDKTEQESTADNYYNALAIEERAKRSSETENGLGLKKMILDQIYPERLRNEVTYNQYQDSKIQIARNGGIRKYEKENEIALKKE